MAEKGTVLDGLFDGLDGSLAIDDRLGFYGLVALVGVIMWGLTFAVGSYWIQVLWILYMYLTLAMAWNYLSGYTGYASFGPIMFLGIGGYSVSFLIVHANLSWPVAFVGAGVVGAVFSIVLGLILLRLSGIYFAIGTLLVAEALREGVLFEDNLLGGSSGMVLTKLPMENVYVIFMLLALVSIVVTYETATSSVGLRMIAIREDEDILGAFGVRPLKYKLFAFAVHGTITSLVGATYALSLGFLYPSTVFSIDITITIILIAILGGMGTVWGPVLGTVILIPIQELFWQEFPSLHLIIYGAFLVFIILFMPNGLMERLKDAGVLPRSRGL